MLRNDISLFVQYARFVLRMQLRTHNVTFVPMGAIGDHQVFEPSYRIGASHGISQPCGSMQSDAVVPALT